ncbi:MAG: 2-polyprenyl-3-methyl-5-hydroxy-6-metoxy-1 [Methanophagales archaeon]|nr:class I SAM-dependent methyltransferase [Methanophagales archaeon]MCU4139987.1 2-polyprenyl-3-methyl-5-hydroxy-6-metoxy-1 [Methanophagales archaeon]
MRKENRLKTLESYYPSTSHKDLRDIPKNMNIDFGFYFREFLDRNDYKMLEIGCATGNFLANDPENIIGIDINKNLLKIARKRGFNVLLVDVENGLCFKDSSFDAIHASHIIEHLSDPIYFMKECFRILKEGGKLVVITEDFSKAYKIFYDDPTHISPLTRKSLKICAIEAGFKVKDIKVERQCVPTGIGLLVRKGYLSMSKALFISKCLYKVGIYKHKQGTLVLEARKG